MTGIAVIIVNYGTAALAVRAAQSVLDRHGGAPGAEIHIVDNASPGDDAEILAQFAAAAAPAGRVVLHRAPGNLGFAGGNNLVLDLLARRATPPEFVFLLNPDARLLNDAPSRLAAFLAAHPRAGVAGARIRSPDGRPVTAAFRFPSLASVFADAVALGPVSRLFGRWRVPLDPDLPTGRVDWVAGAAMMARLEALARVDFFDPAFFLYFEEVDLMRRLRAAGWETWHVAEAEVEHDEGVATGVRSAETVRRRRPAYWYESWRIYFARTLGRPGAAAALLAWMAGAALNFAVSAARGASPRAPLHFYKDAWSTIGRRLMTAAPDAPMTEPTGRFAPNDGATDCNPAGLGFWALVAEDFRTHGRDPLSQGFWALFWHRFGNWRMRVRPRLLRAPLTLLYRLMYKGCQWFGGIMLPYTVRVGRRVRLEHFGGMILVAHSIGDDVVIRQNTTFGVRNVRETQGRPIIGARVDIGAGAVVIGAIEVGEDAVIGANAVVTRPVPPGAVVGGAPARLLREGRGGD